METEARALIVGCGRIAGGFNEANEDNVLTHVVAYRKLGAVVVGCCDVHADKAEHFAKRWGIQESGTDLTHLLSRTQPDVVSVCMPEHGRLEIIREVLACAGVRCLLVEKPLVTDSIEARELLELAESGDCVVLVNHLRAFDPFYQKLETECRQGELQPLCEGIARYYGTASTNACHWVERLLAMFGEPTASRRLGGDAQTPVFELQFGRGRVVFVPSIGCEYSPFELDLLFERKRVRIIDSERRVETFTTKPDSRFHGFANLVVELRWPHLHPSHDNMIRSVQAAMSAARGDQVAWRDLLERAVKVSEILEEISQE